jgi:hypothetical protein
VDEASEEDEESKEPKEAQAVDSIGMMVGMESNGKL